MKRLVTVDVSAALISASSGPGPAMDVKVEITVSTLFFSKASVRATGSL